MSGGFADNILKLICHDNMSGRFADNLQLLKLMCQDNVPGGFTENLLKLICQDNVWWICRKPAKINMSE